MGILRLALGEGTTMKLFVLLASSPWLWLMPSPRLMPTPTTATTAWATMVLATVLDTTTDTPVLATTDTVLDTTARGPLRPSPPLPLMLMLRLIPTTATVCTDTTDKCPADSRQLRNYIKFK